MRLGRIARDKVRHVVGLYRRIESERYRTYELGREKRGTKRRLEELVAASERELNESRREPRFNSAEEKARDEQRLQQHIEDLKARLAEVDQEIERSAAQHDALSADVGKARGYAESLMRLLDQDEQILREELAWAADGVQPPRVLPEVD